MMYKQIECPTCGNLTLAKSIDEPQKCKWCRRPYKVKVTGENKKAHWSAESADFDGKYKDNL